MLHLHTLYSIRAVSIDDCLQEHFTYQKVHGAVALMDWMMSCGIYVQTGDQALFIKINSIYCRWFQVPLMRTSFIPK